jgi:hypothetical protein
MSLNLGGEFYNLALRLRDNETFAELRVALGEAAMKQMSDALNTPPELRVHATAYAAAVRDLYLQFESAARAVRPTQIKLPRLDIPENSGAENSGVENSGVEAGATTTVVPAKRGKQSRPHDPAEDILG